MSSSPVMPTLALLSAAAATILCASGLAYSQQLCGQIGPELWRPNEPETDCAGELDYDKAISCVNRLRKALAKSKSRDDYRERQIKCLCELVVGDDNQSAHYSALRGECRLK